MIFLAHLHRPAKRLVRGCAAMLDASLQTPAILQALVSFALAALVALALQRDAFGPSASNYATGWLCVKLAIATARIAGARCARTRTDQVSSAALRWTDGPLVADAVTWGAGAFYLLAESTSHWTLVPGIISVVAAVDLCLAPSNNRLFALPMIAFAVLGLFFRRGDEALAVSLALFALVVLILRESSRAARQSAFLAERQQKSEGMLAAQAQALALAKRQSSSKNRFLAVVSHEVRTPLHGMLGLLRLTSTDLPKIATTALAHYRLQMIEEAGLHLERILNDLLDVTFLESGMFQLHPIPFRLLDKINAVTETYTAMAAERGIGFKAYIQPSLEGVVFGDPVRLLQILHNLLSNAFKFTQLGGTVAIEIERLPGSQIIQFVVRDDGPGVPDSERAAIFEMFSQGVIGAARPEGHGLGLAISRQLARAMGGDLQYRATGPIGSAFACTVHLPSQLAMVGAPLPANKPDTQRLARRSNYAGLTVYVADDDEASLLVSASVIRNLGCDLETFEDGYQLLDRFLTTPRRPDAIVMDWDMPKMDGRAATRAIRNHESRNNYRKVPIIGVSANATPSFATAAVRAGMTVFLTKPCAPEELAAAIAANIGQEAKILYDAS